MAVQKVTFPVTGNVIMSTNKTVKTGKMAGKPFLVHMMAVNKDKIPSDFLQENFSPKEYRTILSSFKVSSWEQAPKDDRLLWASDFSTTASPLVGSNVTLTLSVNVKDTRAFFKVEGVTVNEAAEASPADSPSSSPASGEEVTKVSKDLPF